MGGFFHIGDEDVRVLRPIPFHANHKEDDLQRWADENPHLLNNGQPMLSLGREIETRHSHAIDNLFLDGNGHLVVAELKRGKSPRNVTAQAIDYGAYVSRLDWEQIDALCRKRHEGASLNEAYKECFGSDLYKSEKPEHRLLIVAETYDPSVEDAAAYLNNTGVNLTLLAFNYFELNGERLLDIRVVLGEIPEQAAPAKRPIPSKEKDATDGYRNWLSRTIRDEFPRFAEARGVRVNLGRGERYLSFTPDPWPYSLGDCRFSIGLNVQSVGIYFSYLNDRVPPVLYEQVKAIVSDAGNPYDVARLKTADQWTTLSHSATRPKLGNMDEVNILFDEALGMVDAIAPLVLSLTPDKT